MPNTVKNLQKIAPLLSEADILKLEKGAALHKRHSNITFKITSVEGSTIYISTRQEKHLAENYLSLKDLIDRTKELFSKFLPGYKLNVGPIKYTPNIIETINAKYLTTMMFRKSIRAKEIAEDTGIDKTTLSHWISGGKEMSHPVKAMFYYYFLWKPDNNPTYPTNQDLLEASKR